MQLDAYILWTVFPPCMENYNPEKYLLFFCSTVMFLQLTLNILLQIVSGRIKAIW